MKAIVCERYGPPEVLRLAEVARPRPKPDQVLIRVRCATVTMGDCELRAFRFPGWLWVPLRLLMGITRPRQPILGMEVAGEVAEAGSAVSRFAVGDRVFGSMSFGMGGYAEYVATRAEGPLAAMPAGLSFAAAAGIPTGGLNGLHFVRKCGVAAGERVLVNGAGGSIGTFAVQIAKLRGAHVTAVDRADKLAMLRGLGADETIDYAAEDFTRRGETWDVIIDVVGGSPFGRSFAALAPGGRYCLGNPRGWQMLRALVTRPGDGRRVVLQMAGEDPADLDLLKDMVVERQLRVVIDRHFPLAEVAAAHRYVEAGNKQGIVVIDLPG